MSKPISRVVEQTVWNRKIKQRHECELKLEEMAKVKQLEDYVEGLSNENTI